jgi:hypothetical protein
MIGRRRAPVPWVSALVLVLACGSTWGAAWGGWGVGGAPTAPATTPTSAPAPTTPAASPGLGEDDLTRLLRRAVIGGVNDASGRADRGGRSQALRALRRLHDPALEPLFAQLAISEDPEFMLQGLLGAAECAARSSTSGAGMNLLALRTGKREDVRVAAVREAIDDDLLTGMHLADMLRWPDLSPTLVVFISGELVARQRGSTPDMAVFPLARLVELMDDRSAPVAVHAALLVMTLGEAPSLDRARAVIASRSAELLAPSRQNDLLALLSLVRTQGLSGAHELLAALDSAGDAAAQGASGAQPTGALASISIEALRTRLALLGDSPETLAAFNEAWALASGQEDPARADLGARIRLAMGVLDGVQRAAAMNAGAPMSTPGAGAAAGGAGAGGGASARATGPSTTIVNAVAGDPDPLVAALGRAARERSAGTGAELVEALRALVSLRHAPSAALATEVAEALPGLAGVEARLAIRRAVLDTLDDDSPRAVVRLGELVSASLLEARDEPAQVGSEPGGSQSGGSLPGPGANPSDAVGQRVLVDALGRALNTGNATLAKAVLLGTLRARRDPARVLAAVDDSTLATSRLRGGERDTIEALRDVAEASWWVSRRPVEAPGGGGAPASNSPTDVAARLARIALGQGGLEGTQRVQAAWLSLRRSGQDRAALARLLGDLGP